MRATFYSVHREASYTHAANQHAPVGSIGKAASREARGACAPRVPGICSASAFLGHGARVRGIIYSEQRRLHQDHGVAQRLDAGHLPFSGVVRASWV